MKAAEHPPVAVGHLLDPLTADEIEAASRILKDDRGLTASARFVYVELLEPSKDEVLGSQPGEAFERQAHIVLRERAECRTYEAVVSIMAGDVRLWREVPGVQPAIMLEVFLAAETAVKKDARWQEAMRRRGVTDFDMVMIDPWPWGYKRLDHAADQGRFLLAADLGAPGRPRRQRIRPPGRGPDRPLRPRPDGSSGRRGSRRGAVAATQRQLHRCRDPRRGKRAAFPSRAPAGSEASGDHPAAGRQLHGVDGHAVRWQKWRFQVGFTPRARGWSFIW